MDVTEMACGGCGMKVQVQIEPIGGLAAYSYLSNSFFQLVREMMHDHQDFADIDCPACGEHWHFLNSAPLLPQIGHA
jgi:hypothetical protein